MRRLAVLICTVCLLPVVPAADAPAQPADPSASASAKKKCRKGHERRRVAGKVKCVRKRRTGGGGAGGGGAAQDPSGTWRSLVAGSSFTSSTFNATSGGSTKTVFGFCADGGSFTYYYELVGQVYNEAKNRSGTYTLTKAQAGTDDAGPYVDGLIAYQSDIEEAPTGQAVVRVYPGDPGRAFIDSGDGATEFSRSAGDAGC